MRVCTTFLYALAIVKLYGTTFGDNFFLKKYNDDDDCGGGGGGDDDDYDHDEDDEDDDDSGGRVARSPVFSGSSRISAPTSRLPDRSQNFPYLTRRIV